MVQLNLTKQQSELWYAYKLNPKADNYNIAVSYRVKGNLDKEKFESIYLKIGYYFEAFRTQFFEYDGKLIALFGKVGKDRAYILLNKKIYNKIMELYPFLECECYRQLNDKSDRYSQLRLS